MKLISILAALAVFLGMAAASTYAPPRMDSNAVVKVVLERGHGSATHIGNGYYITAAHVVKANEAVKIKTDSGQVGKAEVLWANNKYDIALMRSGLEGVASADLECREPGFGEELEFRGNPLNLEHISTWGKVAGGIKAFPGFWAGVLPIDGAIAPGMSGGAVLDSQGDLVGVNVGVMIMQIGLGGGPAGIGYIVPASVVCDLMGLSA